MHVGIVCVSLYVLSCKTELSSILAVGYLHSPILRKDDLLRDQTAMDQPLILQVLDGESHLNEDFPLLVSGQYLIFFL